MGKMLADFAAEHGSPLTQTHVQFAREAADVLRDDLESKASKKQLRKLHLRMRHNPIFYCTRTEIVIGDIDETAWEPIRKEVAWGLDVSTVLAATSSRVLRSETGCSIVEHVRRQEQIHETQVIHTCAHGVSTETSDERYWLDMFSGRLPPRTSASSCRTCGCPGSRWWPSTSPFRNQTGYGPEQIGKKCTFLQGPETEQYLIDEIVDALRECKGLAVKLTNVKKDGSAFQCYLALHPVFGANGEYLYQVGAQVDMTGRPSDARAQLKTLSSCSSCCRRASCASSYAKSLARPGGPGLAKVRDTDEWLGAFTQIAETWPACIVVSDMTIPARRWSTNPEFCRVTEYTTAGAVGRNCRFLQGPDTEPESIGVIQRTLGKCEDCHVLLTNYRKSGEKFKNLSMRPVLDADDVYRFVIGVQFEVIEDDNLPMRLGQLDRCRACCRKKLPPVFDAWDKYSYCVGAQVDLTDASVPVDRLVSRPRDVGRRAAPLRMGGKRFRTDHTEEVVASVRDVTVVP
ncbi:PAS domain-containing protein [Aureococcus anophagefferens]|nr:PAS domain-containing protein [Aureococcus anophagefferens]